MTQRIVTQHHSGGVDRAPEFQGVLSCPANCRSPSVFGASARALSPRELLSLSPLDVAETSGSWLSPQLSGGQAAATREACQEVPVPGRDRGDAGPTGMLCIEVDFSLASSLCPQENMTLLIADPLGGHLGRFGGSGTWGGWVVPSRLTNQARERGLLVTAFLS